jgi:hypothetical protein
MLSTPPSGSRKIFVVVLHTQSREDNTPSRVLSSITSAMEDPMQVDLEQPQRETGRSQSPTKVQFSSVSLLQSIREEIVQSFLQLGPELVNGLRGALKEEVQGLRGSLEVYCLLTQGKSCSY